MLQNKCIALTVLGSCLLCIAGAAQTSTRPEFPTQLKEALDKQCMRSDFPTVYDLANMVSLASNVSVVVQDVSAFAPFSVKEATSLHVMEAAVYKSGNALCFIVRPYGILITTVKKAASIPGPALPSNVPAPPAAPTATRPKFPSAVERALNREPLTLSWSGGREGRLSSLVETLNIACERAFVLEQDAGLNPFFFSGSTPKDAMLAISEMTEGRICFVARDYGILAATRETAKNFAGPSIPEDLPYDPPQQAKTTRPAMSDDMRRLLTKEPLTFSISFSDLRSPETGDMAKVVKLTTGLEFTVDREAPLLTQLTAPPDIRQARPSPRVFMTDGNCLHLMQAMAEGANNTVCFVLHDNTHVALTDTKKAAATSGPTIPPDVPKGKVDDPI